MNEKLPNKLGFITIHQDLNKFWLESFKALYQKVIPIRSINFDQYCQPIIKMVCYCEDFREVPENEEIPEYIVTFHREESGKIIIKELKEKI